MSTAAARALGLIRELDAERDEDERRATATRRQRERAVAWAAPLFRARAMILHGGSIYEPVRDHAGRLVDIVARPVERSTAITDDLSDPEPEPWQFAHRLPADEPDDAELAESAWIEALNSVADEPAGLDDLGAPIPIPGGNGTAS